MNALDYAQRLIRFDSTSRHSNVQITEYVNRALMRIGFETEVIEYTDSSGVKKANVIGRRGDGSKGLAYFGHTDVVPADAWWDDSGSPFEPVVHDQRLYGRGSTDMKGSIACMLAAAERLADRSATSPLYISCTADEEVNHRGADEIVERSEFYAQLAAGGASGIVGEPTQLKVVYAHKGGCRLTITSHGKAAHSSTREGVNANLAMIPFLSKMKTIFNETETEAGWRNDEFDPPTVCWNIGINDHTAATNITPPQSICTIAFRPMPGTDTAQLRQRVEASAEYHGLTCQLDALHAPFRTDPQGDFVQAAVAVSGSPPPRTVSYGTEASNLRGIDSLIVLGPGDIAQAHTHDEWIGLEQLERCTGIYQQLIERYCLR